jgi:hypothetical protein
MLSAILRAKNAYFDIIPAGRLINRFSNDIGILDNEFFLYYCEFLECLSVVVSIIVGVAIDMPWYLGVVGF